MGQQQIHYTPRELQIIKLLLMGVPRKRIAGVLGITEDTVNIHIKHILLKTNWHSMTDLVIYFLSHDFCVNDDRTIVTYMGRQL
jgi:DNA-binding NarL/FixJ family response regulator